MTEGRLFEAERALLRAGAEEAPSVEARQAAARAIGISSAGLFAYGLHFLLRGVTRSSLSGYAIASAVAVAAAGGSYFLHGAPFADVTDKPHSSVTVATPAVRTSTSPLVEEPSLATRTEPASAVSPAAETPRAVAGHGASHAKPLSDAVRQQVSVLDRARSLTASGDLAGALRAIDEYGRRFPDGLFSEEASLLRMDVALARNDHGTAEVLARRFVSEHPQSVHGERARAVLKTK
jgi:TolA-binding protein